MKKNRYYFQIIDSDTNNIIADISCIKKDDKSFQAMITKRACEYLFNDWLYKNLSEKERNKFFQSIIYKKV